MHGIVTTSAKQICIFMQGDAAGRLVAIDDLHEPRQEEFFDAAPARPRGGDAAAGEVAEAEYVADYAALALHDDQGGGADFADDFYDAVEGVDEDGFEAMAQDSEELLREPLYQGADVTVGEAVYGFGQLKQMGRMFDKAFTATLKFVHRLLPKPNKLPRCVCVGTPTTAGKSLPAIVRL